MGSSGCCETSWPNCRPTASGAVFSCEQVRLMTLTVLVSMLIV